jgi:hypothetical protein
MYQGKEYWNMNIDGGPLSLPLAEYHKAISADQGQSPVLVVPEFAFVHRGKELQPARSRPRPTTCGTRQINYGDSRRPRTPEVAAIVYLSSARFRQRVLSR